MAVEVQGGCPANYEQSGIVQGAAGVGASVLADDEMATTQASIIDACINGSNIEVIGKC